MTGCAYPKVLVAIWRAWKATDAAAETYHRCLSLLIIEGQPGIGLAIRKEVLRLRGADRARYRPPPRTLPRPGDRPGLAHTLGRLDMRERFDPESVGFGETTR